MEYAQSIEADTLKGEMVDLAVQFTDSEIVVHSNYVDLCLTGDNGKQYHLYGTSATYLIDMVTCDDLYSYGPLI